MYSILQTPAVHLVANKLDRHSADAHMLGLKTSFCNKCTILYGQSSRRR